MHVILASMTALLPVLSALSEALQRLLPELPTSPS